MQAADFSFSVMKGGSRTHPSWWESL